MGGLEMTRIQFLSLLVALFFLCGTAVIADNPQQGPSDLWDDLVNPQEQPATLTQANISSNATVEANSTLAEPASSSQRAVATDGPLANHMMNNNVANNNHANPPAKVPEKIGQVKPKATPNQPESPMATPTIGGLSANEGPVRRAPHPESLKTKEVSDAEPRVGTPKTKDAEKRRPEAAVYYRSDVQTQNGEDLGGVKTTSTGPKRIQPVPTFQYKKTGSEEVKVGSFKESAPKKHPEAAVHFKTNSVSDNAEPLVGVKDSTKGMPRRLPTFLPTKGIQHVETPVAEPAKLRRAATPHLPQSLHYKTVQADHAYASPIFPTSKHEVLRTMDEDLDIQLDAKPIKRRSKNSNLVQTPINPPSDMSEKKPEASASKKEAFAVPVGVRKTVAQTTPKTADAPPAAVSETGERKEIKINSSIGSPVTQEDSHSNGAIVERLDDNHKAQRSELGSPVTETKTTLIEDPAGEEWDDDEEFEDF
eukprot:TRINITY_DN1472_c0_g1_i4.p1 TRINITY_DN1472_c0_g1~~TRINITY_DN1472_c0_g1_i4.p1  ORF type:complete len:478 (+),score=106.20 TRINITY_DN1472_c0_g1_i4:100-1533(+)